MHSNIYTIWIDTKLLHQDVPVSVRRVTSDSTQMFLQAMENEMPFVELQVSPLTPTDPDNGGIRYSLVRAEEYKTAINSIATLTVCPDYSHGSSVSKILLFSLPYKSVRPSHPWLRNTDVYIYIHMRTPRRNNLEGRCTNRDIS